MKALLIHGLSSNPSTWWRVADALKEQGWDVTSPDLRGHGTADRADSYALEDYAGDLPDGPFDLIVGHSLGGAIAVLRAATARRLVLLDPVLEVAAAEWDAVRADQIAELDLTAAQLDADKPYWDARDRAGKLAAVRAADRRMVGATFDDNPGWNMVAEAEALTVPTLVLGGDHAVYSMLATETAEAIATANPLVEYRLVEGAGHSVHRDRPDVVIDALLSLPA